MALQTSSLDAFLDELTALTAKHGLKIAACGCCASPWIEPIDDKGHQPDLLAMTYCATCRTYGAGEEHRGH